jgi:hypothetical protein
MASRPLKNHCELYSYQNSHCNAVRIIAEFSKNQELTYFVATWTTEWLKKEGTLLFGQAHQERQP